MSNIGWDRKDDIKVYELMKKKGFSGLEIAPTRIFPEQPYNRLREAKEWKEKLHVNYGFSVSSMQSIWYGRTEKIFESEQERDILYMYTKKAIDFAEMLECKNLVFGCPTNRYMPKHADMEIAALFFKMLGDYAYNHHTVIAIEANPTIYNTNFLNTTEEAINFIERVGSDGVRLNLDLGTMIVNEEDINIINGKTELINHVHISEPRLKSIKKRCIHSKLAVMLRKMNYEGFVSVEMGKQESMETLISVVEYVKGVFG